VVAGQIPDVHAIAKATLSDPLLGQQAKNVTTQDFPDALGGIYASLTRYDLGNGNLVNVEKSPVEGTKTIFYKTANGTSRLDGPSIVKETKDKISYSYFIDDKVVDEKDYWKDPRVIEYAKTKGTAAPAPVESANYGNRSDGTPKGKGWLGELKLPDGSVATEYTAQSQSVKVNGKQIDFPTLVPSLTKDEIQLMVNDIIPSKKPIPDSIMQKAVDHARTRLEAGKSVFADIPAPTYEERTAPDGRVFRKYADGRIVEVINN
jgi:hypothetical protein